MGIKEKPRRPKKEKLIIAKNAWVINRTREGEKEWGEDRVSRQLRKRSSSKCEENAKEGRCTSVKEESAGNDKRGNMWTRIIGKDRNRTGCVNGDVEQGEVGS